MPRLAAKALAGVDATVGINRQEHALAVAEGADLALGTAEALAYLVERRDGEFSAMLDVVVEHLAEERGVLGGGEEVARTCRLRIWRQA